MFTVEMEHDATVITTMDQRDEFEDVECIIGDDNVVFLRQWNETAENHDLLYLSFQQLTDLFAAMRSPEGMFKLVNRAWADE